MLFLASTPKMQEIADLELDSNYAQMQAGWAK